MPDTSADALFEQARALDAQGRTDEAQRAYLAVLDADARHFGALTNLAYLLERRGFAQAALQGYREAAQWHPENAIGRANLGAALLDAGDLDGARAEYEAALRLAPDSPQAHQGMGAVFSQLGDEARAQPHLAIGFHERNLVHEPFRGIGTAPRILLLLSARGGNVDLRQFLDDRRYDVWKLFTDVCDPQLEPPPHDAIVNAIGDADRCRGALEAAVALTARSAAPVLNDPRAVLETGRLQIARRLAQIPGVRTPSMALVSRVAIGDLPLKGLGYPFLLRARGHHTGGHFVRVDGPTQLAGAAAQLPGEDLLAIEFLNARGRDGNFRKYRVMLVRGALYPLHLAISPNWMVHYFSAQNLITAAHEPEEAAFLSDMPAALGPKAMQALQSIAGVLGLDYAGVDFGLDADGDLLLFEANATMTIPHLSEAPRDYRRAALVQVCAAVSELLQGAFAPENRKGERREELSQAERIQLGTLLPEEQRQSERRS